MVIVQLYSLRIVSAGHDSMSARRDLPLQFDKSRNSLITLIKKKNLLFSIVFGFKRSFLINLSFTIIFYQFFKSFSSILLSFSIKFELLNDNNDDKFIKNDRFTIILGRYDMLERFYSSQTSSCYINFQSSIVSTDVRLKCLFINLKQWGI